MRGFAVADNDKPKRYSARTTAGHYINQVRRTLLTDEGDSLSVGERAIITACYAQINATLAVLEKLDEIAGRLPLASAPVTVSGLEEVRVSLDAIRQALGDK
jgi:hypothetical protein